MSETLSLAAVKPALAVAKASPGLASRARPLSSASSGIALSLGFRVYLISKLRGPWAARSRISFKVRIENLT